MNSVEDPDIDHMISRPGEDHGVIRGKNRWRMKGLGNKLAAGARPGRERTVLLVGNGTDSLA